MLEKKFTDNRETRWSISSPTLDDPTLIVCPACGSQGKIFPVSAISLRAVCGSCAFSAEHPKSNAQFAWQDANPTDGYFGYALWLQTDCAGHSLWAFNHRHLDLLEDFVGAKLRQRSHDSNKGWRNSSLFSTLPKWVKLSRNRALLLRSIAKLRAMA
jgi:hypothetical protein